MKKIKSTKSTYVKSLNLIYIVVNPIVFIGIFNKYGIIEATILISIMMIVFAYLYSISLKYIIKTDKELILIKGFSKIVIPYNNIKEINPLKGSVVKITFGSKGIFGFNGIAMEGKNCFINDLNKIVLIKTIGEDFLISCDNLNELTKKV
ncbi:PH domain-containing protein [Chishuiella sp.]|uniref:PH domain-containing protein n=1 Tax=Chishuiella sp. TaxID=1969467 RepID=UPI0028A70548|nr:PH domain-containing protein [Chishuiella sp.]